MAPAARSAGGSDGQMDLGGRVDRVYGTIEIRRVNPTEVRYGASFRGEVIGWSTTLRPACERVHGES